MVVVVGGGEGERGGRVKTLATMIGEQRKINSFFLILYFLSESLKAKTKTSKRDYLFYNTVLLKKPCFFHKPQLT